jgi:hypothetical protein
MTHSSNKSNDTVEKLQKIHDEVKDLAIKKEIEDKIKSIQGNKTIHK